MTLLRKLSPEDAERRLQEAPGFDVKATGSRQGEKLEGVQYLESRLLSALGRWKLPISQKARAILSRNGLPDTAENRCSAMVAAAEEETDLRCETWDDWLREERAARLRVQAITATESDARRRLHALQDDVAAYKSQAQNLKADLDAARAEAQADYDAEYKRQLQLLQLNGYAPHDIQAVIDAVQTHFPDVGTVSDLLEIIESLGGTNETRTALRDRARLWERYLGFLKEEAEDQERDLSLERIEKAWVLADAGIEPTDAVHCRGEELARFLASFGMKVPAPEPVGGQQLTPRALSSPTPSWPLPAHAASRRPSRPQG